METKGDGLRVFGIDAAGAFDEYARLPFEAKHTEATLEDWLESNPEGIGEEGECRDHGPAGGHRPRWFH